MANGEGFIAELTAFQTERLLPIVRAGQGSLETPTSGDLTKLLQVALTNELNVTDLARAWMDTIAERDVKAAFAKQAEDERGHAKLISDRLALLGIELPSAEALKPHPLFDYLRTLSGTVERVAAALFTLEAMAYEVNAQFITLCDRHGDVQTSRIYREYIQPDENMHQQMGRRLLVEHAQGAEQATAFAVVGKVLEIAASARGKAAQKMGTACLPGC